MDTSALANSVAASLARLAVLTIVPLRIPKIAWILLDSHWSRPYLCPIIRRLISNRRWSGSYPIIRRLNYNWSRPCPYPVIRLLISNIRGPNTGVRLANRGRLALRNTVVVIVPVSKNCQAEEKSSSC